MRDRPEPSSPTRHARVRRQHSNELAQDYVEAIRGMRAGGAAVRVADLQEVFGVSHVTVIRALRRFEKRGLLRRSKADGVILTGEGERMAGEAASRHELVVRVLRHLGVSRAKAEADAEGIEHHLSRETLAAFRRFANGREESRD